MVYLFLLIRNSICLMRTTNLKIKYYEHISLDRNSNTGSAGFLYHQDKHLDDQKQSEGKINLYVIRNFDDEVGRSSKILKNMCI